MRRIITGGTGLIGKRLTEHWLARGHQITIIGRSKRKINTIFGSRVNAVSWDDLTLDMIKDAEIVVNLAGANLAEKRWTDARRQEIIDSRVNATQTLVNLMTVLGEAAPPLFNASAIGVYGLQPQASSGLPIAIDEDVLIDWDHPTDFLSLVARKWERTAQPLLDLGARVVFLRFGVVLTREGGALPQLLRPFRFCLGGTVGSGMQPFSWVAIEDLIKAIDFLFEKNKAQGPFNIVAPGCVTQRTLAETIGSVMHKPSILPTPTFLLELMLGKEMTNELLLEGQHVYPKRLLAMDFQFSYPTIESALEHVIHQDARQTI